MKAHVYKSTAVIAKFLRSRYAAPFFVALFGLAFLIPEVAHAALPWEATISSVACSLKGPIAQSVAVIAVVVAGLMFAFGESGGIMKTLLSVVMGCSIALLAANWVGNFSSASGTGAPVALQGC